jgi:hypothetical protein
VRGEWWSIYPANVRGEWWSIYPAVAAVTVAMSSDANSWLSDLISQMPTNLDDIRPVRTFLDRLGQERPRFVRSERLGYELLGLLQRGHISDVDTVVRLDDIKGVRDSVADALSGVTVLDVGAQDTRAARYGPRSQTPEYALSISTTVLSALVGEERLRQIAQSVAARPKLRYWTTCRLLHP